MIYSLQSQKYLVWGPLQEGKKKKVVKSWLGPALEGERSS